MYYYLKIYTYYNGNGEHFSSYSITNTFTQTNIATIRPTLYDTVGNCTSDSIVYRCARSHLPYTVQLYRFNTPYGSPVISTKVTVTFRNLPSGSYYATVYGDGATGTAFGKSKITVIEPIPTGLNTTNIQSKQATLNWTNVPCAAYYTVEYKVHGTDTWKKKFTVGNISSYILKPLVTNTQYDWKVAVTDSANGVVATGLFTDSISFTITQFRLLQGNADDEDNLSIYPDKGKGILI